jgi:hypothetical protein
MNLLLLSLACRPGTDSDKPSESVTGLETGVIRHSEETGADSVAPTGPVGHVIVLVMDGTRIEESFGEEGVMMTASGDATETFLPTLRTDLLPKGTLVRPGIAAGVTITAPGHCDLVVGTRLPYGNYGIDGSLESGLYRPPLPTMGDLLRQQQGASANSTQVGGNASLLAGLTYSLYPGVSAEGDYLFIEDPDSPGSALNDDVLALDALQSALGEEERRLVVFNLHTIDRGGHYGSASAYPDSVKRVDAPILAFWDWLQSTPPYAGDTVLVLVSDHGRHRWGESQDWRNHGDQCAGCREVPMFLIGPGIARGVEVDTPHTLEDLSATLAARLGLRQDYGTGKTIDEALNVDEEHAPSGTLRFAQTGRDRIEETVSEGRSVITVDGAQISGSEALMAEMPVASVSADGGEVLCWRELTLGAADERDWPWTGECRSRRGEDADWSELDFPLETVSPYFEPALVHDDRSRLYMGVVDSPNGNIERPGELDFALRLLRWTPTQRWEGMDQGSKDISLATHPSLAVDSEGELLLAYATADAVTTDRASRHIALQRVRWPTGQSQQWAKAWSSPDTDAEGKEYGRAERPVVWSSEGLTSVAWLAYSTEGISLLLSQETDGWTDPIVLDDQRVLGHITPRVASDTIWYARLSEGDTVELCQVTAEGSPSCTDTGQTAIFDLELQDGTASASLGQGGSWTLTSP